MAKQGQKFTFHGAFGTKAAAIKKERKVGGFIKPIRIKGRKRYVVMTKREH